MSARRGALTLAAACLASAALLPSTATAAPAPAWTLSAVAEPGNFTPGKVGEYVIVATNVGAAATDGTQTTLDITVPDGLEILTAEARNSDPEAGEEPQCEEPLVGPVITCETSEVFGSSRLFIAQVQVKVPPLTPEGPLSAGVTVSGGGATDPVQITLETPVQGDPLGFGFLAGFEAPLTEEDGSPATIAGSHPYQQSISFAFPTRNLGSGLTNDGHPKNVYVDLPPGLIGNPAASPVLCTEAELVGSEGCPDESEIGIVGVTTTVGEAGNNTVITSNLYNMVPPPGSVAQIATDVATVGVFLHIQAGVRSEAGYGVEGATHDIIAFGRQPIFGVSAQIWGDPSATSHDDIRGDCRDGKGLCPADPQETAFLTLPGDCGAPPTFEVRANTWEGAEASPTDPAEHTTTYESADRFGNPAPIEECAGLEFEPEIAAQLSTNRAESASGFDFSLHQPQQTDLGSRAKAALRDLALRFPTGLAVNPSQAAGLGACTEGQIGFLATDEGGPHFSRAPQSCPDAAKIGTVRATSPLLVARNGAHEVEPDPEDPEGDPLLEPLNGSIYIAQPFANPFGSLIAAYVVIEDPKTGIVAKLAGRGELDPSTGQITTFFEENPQAPIEDIEAHLFGGPRGAFITPPTCGNYALEAALVPWSDPEAEVALSDSFAIAAGAGGGGCPATEAELPNAPRFSAGTESPAAGKFSPLLFKLSREDGSQRFGRIEATLPAGLSAKLAGVGICSEAQIAQARSREVPQKGALEQADPSCPAASRLGTVNASAGPGPNPYRTQGSAYLAGPYKGAPISIVAIVPAVAGPFDLGAVVLRSAVYLDPATAQGRVLTDPLPTILHGVPIDARSVAVFTDRADFTLNPTSCAEKSFGGQLTSTLGSVAPLFERFQVGGCGSLPYAPKLTAKLFGPTNRGAHPRLQSIFTAAGGEANTSRISFALPRSEFIDQAHFRTICTRVQFAAAQCPAGSVYGHVKAWSPLLDYPLEGPVYLRSSSNKLPDTVLALHGPAYQPLFFEAAGRVDSVNGGLRVRFESVPDAPLSRVVLNTQGAKKGLFQNSTNICKGTHRATLKLDAQNGKVHDTKPELVAVKCKKAAPKGKKGKGKGKGRR
jgi:hypothetical protein